jgi:hypothetical protein
MRLLVLAAALAFASPASASTVTYQVFGSEFTTCEDAESGAACTRYVDEWIGRSFDGTITLDLDALGLPHLGGKTVSATVLPDGTGAEGVFVDLNFIGPRFHAPTGGAEFNFMTDAKGNPVSWSVDVLDGPPDYFIGRDALVAFFPDPVFLSGIPGDIRAITAVPIPLPAPLLLLLGGVAALVLAHRRRTSRA